MFSWTFLESPPPPQSHCPFLKSLNICLLLPDVTPTMKDPSTMLWGRENEFGPKNKENANSKKAVITHVN